MTKKVTIAIDGPAGAGKSTVAKKLAKALEYSLVDTGAIYRSVAWLAIQEGVALHDEDSLAKIAEALQIFFRFEGDANQVFLLHHNQTIDVSTHIRTPQVSIGASQISSLPKVRAALLGLQRRLGDGGGVVLEGRDIGTVVCPNAEAKFFLTASVDARAKRRHQELLEAGEPSSLEETKKLVEARDLADTSRAVAPLRQAEDAVLVDASDKNADEIVDEMVRIVFSLRDI